MATTHPVETNFGTVTSWLPVTTAFPMSAPCSSMYIVHGNFSDNNQAFLFDPTYGISVDSNFRCLPPEASTWWNQQSLGNSGTSLGLGPIVCPAAYTTVTTTVVNPGSTLVACCPTGFQYNMLLSEPLPAQCISRLRASEVITYASPAGQASWAVTSGSQTTVATVVAIQFNGYIFASSTSSAASSISSAASSISSVASSISSATSSPPTSAASSSSAGLSSGATIGISVGVALGIIIASALGFFFFHRYKTGRVREGFQPEGLTGQQSSTNDKNRPIVEMSAQPMYGFAGMEGRHEL